MVPCLYLSELLFELLAIRIVWLVGLVPLFVVYFVVALDIDLWNVSIVCGFDLVVGFVCCEVRSQGGYAAVVFFGSCWMYLELLCLIVCLSEYSNSGDVAVFLVNFSTNAHGTPSYWPRVDGQVTCLTTCLGSFVDTSVCCRIF